MSKRTYWAKVAIVGPTGTGKSYLSKTADKATTGYINTEMKPLPYKTEPFKFMANPKNWDSFKAVLKHYGGLSDKPEQQREALQIQRIIIDSQTMALQKLNNEMGKSFTGWDVAKNYNKQVFEYLEILKSIEKDIILFSHDELVKIDDGTKQRRMTVHNKEYEGKLEEHLSIVLYTGTRINNNKPHYFLKTFEVDSSAKVPEDLFGTPNPLEIPNDAKYIFDALEKYYSI